MISRIVLAIDSDTPDKPVKMAGELAGFTDATVLVVHCDELDTFFDTGTWLKDDTEPRTAIGTAGARLRDRGSRPTGSLCALAARGTPPRPSRIKDPSPHPTSWFWGSPGFTISAVSSWEARGRRRGSHYHAPAAGTVSLTCAIETPQAAASSWRHDACA